MMTERPAHEVLAQAIHCADRRAECETKQAAIDALNGYDVLASASEDMAQEYRDLAAQLRAMADGPLAEDYEAALEWMRENYGRYTIPEMLTGVRNRALERARERSER